MNQVILLCTLVTNAWKEPNHVWLDNTYNITRILRTVYLGYDRVGMCNVGKVADMVLADMCVKVMIAVAWETAYSHNTQQNKHPCPPGRTGARNPSRREVVDLKVLTF